ncbi:MAG: T9SS C-terminal target domain-containing protein, partial [Calditrichaeota bacterium]
AGTLIGPTGLSAIPGLAITSSGDIYAASGFSNEGIGLYRIDAATGGAIFVGSIGQPFMDGIAFDGNDVLYGLGGNPPVATLFVIDTTTGAATPIGSTGDFMRGMAFDPTDGTLYATTGASQFANVPDAVYTIDVTTGAATLIGQTGLGGSTPDIFFDQAGNLYGAKGGGQNPNNLISIDKTTGAGTVIGSIGFQAVAGMAARLDRVVVGIEPEKMGIPKEFALEQNYPNPFNPSTTIRYALKENTHVALKIYNLLGQLVRTLADEKQNAGHREVKWDGRNDRGVKVASGIYLYRIEAGNFRQSRKMILLR